MHGQERIHAVFNRVTRDWTKLGLLEAVPVHCRGLECMNSVCSPDADCPSDLLWPRGGACPPGLSPASDSPGLNRTMARRQPSSDLSICMSFILDTSSVKTLHGGDMGEHTIRDVFPLKKHLGQALGTLSILLCRKRGIFEAQPCPRPLFYICIKQHPGT